jgi:hypothetical protein
MKWKSRTRLGVNLGFSPQHAKSIHLILSLTIGCVSPQCHCTFDSGFTTLDQYPHIESNWKYKAHFSSKPKEAKIPNQSIDETSTNEMIDTISTRDKDILQVNQGEVELEPILQSREITPNEGAQLRRSNRIRKQPERYGYDNTSTMQDALSTTHDESSIVTYEALQVSTEISDSLRDPILSMKSVADPDTMYLWQARKEKDFPEFLKAMQKEIDDHTTGKHWKLVHKSELPTGATVLPAVWSMKRKRRIAKREVYKWKARSNIDGSKQVHGVHYDQTYSPVVVWQTTRFFLIQSLLNNWKTKQLDFVPAFPQAPVERELYMKLPMGVRLEGDANSDDYVLQILKNLYGQKQAGKVWYDYLGLEEIGFVRSTVDECVFYYKSSVLLVYVDDSILMGPNEGELKHLIKEMGMRCKVQEEGDLCDYLGIQIKKGDDGSMTLTQPQLIDSILKDMKLDKENVKGRKTPAMKTKLIYKDEDGEDFDNRFQYRSVIGQLNYLEKCTRPDIAYAVHQCARFISCPKESHAEAIKYICRYLAATKDKGFILKPSGHKFECYVDSSHAGDWKQHTAMDDPSTAKSRTGYVINFAQCPLVWASRLQTEIALSSTEAEYIALSTASREILPLLSLAKEACKHKIISKAETPVIRCKIFEDNQGAVEMANVPKMRLRTKHLNIKYRFFRQYVQQGILQVERINGEDQSADIFTKPLDYASFIRYRQSIMGW